jgi:hypothetical protein
MQDKLRKIGRFIWNNKERLILAGLLAYLVYRVYLVLQAVPEEQVLIHPVHNAIPERIMAELEESGDLPPVPPPPAPAPYPYGQYASLVRTNPFYMHATTAAAGGGQETQQWDVAVLDVQEPIPGKRRARIRHGTSTAWYDEGDSFVAYELTAVDMEARTATIFSTEHRRSRTFEVSR